MSFFGRPGLLGNGLRDLLDKLRRNQAPDLQARRPWRLEIWLIVVVILSGILVLVRVLAQALGLI